MGPRVFLVFLVLNLFCFLVSMSNSIAVASSSHDIDQSQVRLNAMGDQEQLQNEFGAPAAVLPRNPQSRPNLTSDQRRAVYEWLLEESNGGRLRRGAVKDAASQFGVATKTINRIWSRGRQSIASGAIVANVSSLKAGRVGKKKMPFDSNAIKAVPLLARQSIRALATALNIPKSTLHDRLKEGSIRRHSSAVKPLLTDQNKLARVQFCIASLNLETRMFGDMMNMVHIDEKWFNLMQTKTNVYLAPDEDEPVRPCKSKRFIGKIMFLAAVTRPRHYGRRNSFFDGKIGMWPLVTREPAQRASKNRPAGTMEFKPITSINKQVMSEFMIEKVLPAIVAKWPRCWDGPIYVQQDNAKPHLKSDDPDFVAESQKDGLDIRLTCQPPNSPDMNVLDLGYFRAIQSLQYQHASKTMDELVTATLKSFDDLESHKLNSVFLTMQSCMIEVMKVQGSNGYKVPHMGKEALERAGQLPLCLTVDAELLAQAQEFVNTNNV